MVDLFADALDEFAAQAIAQARSFAGGAQNKKSVHAAGEDVFDESFQPGDIQFIAVAQRRDHRRNDSSQRQFHFKFQVRARFDQQNQRRRSTRLPPLKSRRPRKI